jgi:phage terminase large subunit
MIEISVNEVFWECLTTDKRYVHSYGSRGSGKSKQEAIGFVLDILNPQYFKGVLVREVQDTIRDSQFSEIKKVIEEAKLGDRITANEQRMSFYCESTGNTIISKGLKKSKSSDTARFKSIENPTKVWIEEAEEISEEDFEKIDGSVRKKGAKCQIRFTYNTNIEPDHWIRQKFHKVQRSDTFYLHTTYRVNIDNLDQKYIDSRESLRETDPERYAVEVLGQWGAKKVIRPFATQYKQEKHRKPCTLQPNRTIYLNVDFNLDPFAIGFAHVWEDKEGFHFHNFDEFSIASGNLHEAAKQIKAKYGHLIHNFHVSGDYSGRARSMQSPSNESNYELLMRLLGLNIRQMELKPNPRHENSRSDVNFLLAHAEDFRVDPMNSPELERDFRIVEVDSNEKIIKSNRKDISQQADHLDRFRYLCNTRVVKEWIARKQQNLN